MNIKPQSCGQKMKPDLRCYYHPEREATSQCDVCGDYLCGKCMRSFKKEHVCGTCYEWRTRKERMRALGNDIAKALMGGAKFLVILVVTAMLLACPLGVLYAWLREVVDIESLFSF